jgi:NAD(P)-dependent dehydrogenase (short-subunit alcohol dehydrogenase family)
MKKKTQKAWQLAAAGAGALLAISLLNKRHNAYQFAGKVVLITGGSRGLGLVLGRQLAAEGARLAICARNLGELEAAQQELEKGGAEVYAQVCNLRIEQDLRHMVRQVEEHYGRIDVLINNAGVIQVGPLENMSVEDFREALDVHYWAPLLTMMAVVPGMKERREGRILNIASVGGKVSLPHLVPYSGSKFGLVGLSEGFQTELKKHNIRVTTINPGLMRTGSPSHAIIKGQHEKEYAWFTVTDVIPLISMDVEVAARKIINACRYGVPERTLTMAGKMAVMLHGIAPSLMADYFDLINRFLPGPGSNVRQEGKESDSSLTPEWARKVNAAAARANNE